MRDIKNILKLGFSFSAKQIVCGIVLFTTSIFAQPKFSEYNSMAGSFSRMGFGARGIAMGNSISAVTDGNLVTYYNPALAVFQEGNYFQTSYSFLSLDRSLNFLSFTKKFEFGRREDFSTKKKSVAGISFGIINSGVGNIDIRDGQGGIIKTASTSENQFFLSLSNRFSEKFAVGIGLKFYYYKLYESITSSGFGLDFGLIYKYSENLNFAAVVTDLNTQYKWDTSQLYGIDGNSTQDKFPLLMKVSAAYKFNEPKIIATLEFEHSNAQTDFIRLGAEYNIVDYLFLRGGIDKISIGNFDIPARPALGFSFLKQFDSFTVGVDYAFAIEPYSSHDQHIVGLEILF